MSDAPAHVALRTCRSGAVLHDLSGSDSETLPLADLLALAEPDDLRRWESLGLGYTDPRGAPWLRAAIARRHATLEADDVVCCTGAQEAVTCVARALLGPADHAIVVLPIYRPSEQAVTSLCQATGIALNTGDWSLDLNRVAEAVRPNTRLILMNFPNSPTGAAIGKRPLRDLVDLCRRHGLWLVNDEVYRQTCCAPDNDALSMVADAYEKGVSVNGLSKGFGLPGLRVGWAASRSRHLLHGMLKAKNTMSTCVSSASEVLAHVALRAERAITERTRAIGRRNHHRLRAVLGRSTGLLEADAMSNLAFAFPRCAAPEGADALAEHLHEAGLLVLPSTLWQSTLAAIPKDRLRIGLGHAAAESGLVLLDRVLALRQRAFSDSAAANHAAAPAAGHAGPLEAIVAVSSEAWAPEP